MKQQNMNNTMARPYAKAIFELAVDQDQLHDWKTFLLEVKSIITQEAIQSMINHPQLDMAQLNTILNEALQLEPKSEFANLLKILTSQGRVALLPLIVDEFIRYKEEYQNTLNVHVKTAQALSNDEAERLRQVLALYFGRTIYMTTEVDEDILGGAIIYAKDLVIDGSGRGRLNQLQERLKGKLLCS